jgi:hypothetical protein
MGWFSKWFGQGLQRKHCPDRRTRKFRPTLAELETRVVPATVATNFVNHGGPVLANAQIELIYYGQAWNDSSLQATKDQIDAFMQYLAGSPFMDVMAQYGVGHGQVTDSVVIPDPLGSNVTPQQIQNALTQDIANGTLQPAGTNRLYFVFTPPNVTVNSNPHFPVDFLGYHSSLFDNQNNQDAYAVIPYPGGTNPQASGLTTFQSLTDTASHELAEAVTDPYINAFGRPSGWDDYTFDRSSIVEGEIADIAEDAPPATLNGYTVTQLWSNLAHSIVAPSATTSTADVLTVTGKNVNAVVNQSFTDVVGLVSDTFANVSTSNLTATINWGDGSTADTNVAVTGPNQNGQYTVQGTHTYSSTGSFTITVTVTDSGNTATSSGTGTATVAAASTTGGIGSHCTHDTTGNTGTSGSLSVTAQRVDAITGSSFTGTVANVTDPGADLANLTATINWGDGRVDTNVAVTTDSNGNLIVQGTHTYASPGHYALTVTVTDSNTNNQAQSTSLADVDPSASHSNLRVMGANVHTTAGVSFTNVIAVVYAPGALASDLSVSVDWGDGTTGSNVQLIPYGTRGVFVITGSHTYTTAGSYTIATTVANTATGVTGTSSSTAVVDSATTTSATTLTTTTTPSTTTTTTTASTAAHHRARASARRSRRRH